MFWLFGGKKEVERVEEETKKGFESVKKDILSVSGWIKHLDSEKSLQQIELEEIKEVLASMDDEIESLKKVVSLVGEVKMQRLFKTTKPFSSKQTPVDTVQLPVQTAVQTPKLSDFSITERAILWILLNEDRKLSYEDLAAMLGKEKSTIRGQLNNIKSKSEEDLILEEVEKNGKKRLYIPEKIKEKMLKKQKVRVKSRKKKPKISTY
tara:strand:+ start:235 stop:858 length:624 start_codon:yes stop_codon:yes gene_type:complete